jgi:hypothetical protein
MNNFRVLARGGSAEGRTGREFADSEIYKLLEAHSWEACRSGDPASTRALTEWGAVLAAAQAPDGYLNNLFRAFRASRPLHPPRLGPTSSIADGHLIQAGVGPLAQSGRGRSRARDTPGGGSHLQRVRADRAPVDLWPPRDSKPRSSSFTGELVKSGTWPSARVRRTARLGAAGAPAGLVLNTFATTCPFARRTCSAATWCARCTSPAVPSTWAVGNGRRRVARGRGGAVAAYRGGPHVPHRRNGSPTRGRSVRRRFRAPSGRGVRRNLCGRGLGECSPGGCCSPPARPVTPSSRSVRSTTWSAGAIAADGHGFFYANPLQQRVSGTLPDPEALSPRASTGGRAPWIEVSCCPTNLARTLASLGSYIATADAAGVRIELLTGAEIRTTLANGRRIGLRVDTDYPWQGRVRVQITGKPTERVAAVDSAYRAGPRARR